MDGDKRMDRRKMIENEAYRGYYRKKVMAMEEEGRKHEQKKMKEGRK